MAPTHKPKLINALMFMSDSRDLTISVYKVQKSFSHENCPCEASVEGCGEMSWKTGTKDRTKKAFSNHQGVIRVITRGNLVKKIAKKCGFRHLGIISN